MFHASARTMMTASTLRARNFFGIDHEAFTYFLAGNSI